LFHKTRVFIYIGMLFVCYTKDAIGETIMKPSVTLEERYDSNPYARGEGQSIEGDFITSVTPRLEMIDEHEKLRLNAAYSLNSRYYLKNTILNYTIHNGTLGMNMNISRNLSLQVNDTISYAEDTLQPSDTGIQIGQTGIFSNIFSTNVNQRISPRSTANIMLSNAIYEYKNPAFIDSRTDSTALSWAYGWTADTSVTTTYSFSKYYFDTNVGNNTMESHSFSLGIAERLFSTLSFNLSGGIVYISTLDDRFNWTAGANLTKAFEMSSLNIGYTRATTQPFGLANAIMMNDSITMSWIRTISASFNVTVSAGLSKNSLVSSSISFDTTSYNAGISCNWQTYSWMRLGLGYSRFQQWVEGTLVQDLSRDSVFVNITVVPSEWRF
jgi:hypothetical protein